MLPAGVVPAQHANNGNGRFFLPEPYEPDWNIPAVVITQKFPQSGETIQLVLIGPVRTGFHLGQFFCHDPFKLIRKLSPSHQLLSSDFKFGCIRLQP